LYKEVRNIKSIRSNEQRKEKKMKFYPSFTDIRSQLSHKFFTLQTDARRDTLWARLTGKNTRLAIFPEEAPEKNPGRKFIGTEVVPIEQIVGTIHRQNDFDHKFRPLTKRLRDRWVNVYLTLERDGWSPILVHKVGEEYYVEDGHYRVSIAQALGVVLIPAKVWEYPAEGKKTENCQPEPCPEQTSAQAYAGTAD
jgi:hypothetical protein